MASLTKTYETQKLLGQVYTPRFVVEKMLHDIHFDREAIVGKTILDPSCGDGRFLVVVAERILAYSPIDRLQENLEKIHGWDIDNEAVKACIDNLNTLVQGFDIQVNWNIEVCNSLQKILNFEQKFDFIVGNPPYIRIQHLVESERKFIQEQYTFCKNGSTDIYIAFYELCNHLLAQDGICALITSNTFFYTETAKILRHCFAKSQTIQKITNYGDIQLFENASTYSAITIFGKVPQHSFVYEQAYTTTDFLERTIPFQEIQEHKTWQLSIDSVIETKGIKLKDICKIHVGIMSLNNKIYIFKQKKMVQDSQHIYVETKLKGTIKIEKDILKPIIKASKLKNSQAEITEYILFPYQKVNGKHQIIPEDILQTAYPLAYDYLLQSKDVLEKRDNGKTNPVAWYAFGRSQGLETSFGKKILFSPMNQQPNFVLYEHEDCTFYSGYCIKYEGDYDFLLQQLNSERFANFISISSRDFRGGWKAYNKKIVEDFTIQQ